MSDSDVSGERGDLIDYKENYEIASSPRVGTRNDLFRQGTFLFLSYRKGGIIYWEKNGMLKERLKKSI